MEDSSPSVSSPRKHKVYLNLAVYKSYADKLGISNAAIASHIAVAPHVLYKWVRGSPVEKLTNVMRLSQFFGCDVMTLLTEEVQ